MARWAFNHLFGILDSEDRCEASPSRVCMRAAAYGLIMADTTGDFSQMKHAIADPPFQGARDGPVIDSMQDLRKVFAGCA